MRASRLGVGCRRVSMLLGLSVIVATCAATAHAATATVDCTADPGAFASALASASDGDTLSIQGTCKGTFEITHSITLSGSAGAILDGQGEGPVLTVDAGQTVVVSSLTVSGGSVSSAGGGIWNKPGATLTLNSSGVSRNRAGQNGAGGGIYNEGTLTLNNSTVSGNAVGSNGAGAGILNAFGFRSTLTLNGSTVSGNSGGFGGAGIYNVQAGSVTLNGSTVSGNSTTTDGAGASNGGGLYNGGGPMTITNSTIAGNTAYNGGGGIINVGELTVRGSTVSDNTAMFGGGGGIYNVSSTATVSNTTIVGNTASSGGGIYDSGGFGLTLTNSTIASNTASENGGGMFVQFGAKELLTNTTVVGNSSPSGGGIFNHLSSAAATQVLKSSIVSGNSGGNCVVLGGPAGSISDGGYNLEDATGCGFSSANGSLSNTNPMLNPVGLNDNGGPTQTIALLAGSPAIDAIPFGANGCGTTLTTDQRTVSRPQGSGCDIGSFELGGDKTAPVITVPSGITANATSPSGAVVSYAVTASDPDDAVASLGCVPTSGSTFAIGTTTVTCTASDTNGNTSNASFAIHVKSASEQLVALRAAVTGVGSGTSLADKVTQAQASLRANDVAGACSTLNALNNQLTALSGKSVPTGVATSLISDATRIRNVLGC